MSTTPQSGSGSADEPQTPPSDSSLSEAEWRLRDQIGRAQAAKGFRTELRGRFVDGTLASSHDSAMSNEQLSLDPTTIYPAPAGFREDLRAQFATSQTAAVDAAAATKTERPATNVISDPRLTERRWTLVRIAPLLAAAAVALFFLPGLLDALRSGPHWTLHSVNGHSVNGHSVNGHSVNGTTVSGTAISAPTSTQDGAPEMAISSGTLAASELPATFSGEPVDSHRDLCCQHDGELVPTGAATRLALGEHAFLQLEGGVRAKLGQPSRESDSGVAVPIEIAGRERGSGGEAVLFACDRGSEAAPDSSHPGVAVTMLTTHAEIETESASISVMPFAVGTCVVVGKGRAIVRAREGGDVEILEAGERVFVGADGSMSVDRRFCAKVDDESIAQRTATLRAAQADFDAGVF